MFIRCALHTYIFRFIVCCRWCILKNGLMLAWHTKNRRTHTHKHTRQCDYINFITHSTLCMPLDMPLCVCVCVRYFFHYVLVLVSFFNVCSLTLSFSFSLCSTLIHLTSPFCLWAVCLCVYFADLVVWMFTHRSIYKCMIPKYVLKSYTETTNPIALAMLWLTQHIKIPGHFIVHHNFR